MSVKKQLEHVEEDVSALGENLAVRFKDALTSANDWKKVSQSYIKESPILCLAGAFLVGFAIAKVARHA